eukprot:4687-Heterococcus_DN1.PRE.1
MKGYSALRALVVLLYCNHTLQLLQQRVAQRVSQERNAEPHCCAMRVTVSVAVVHDITVHDLQVRTPSVSTGVIKCNSSRLDAGGSQVEQCIADANAPALAFACVQLQCAPHTAYQATLCTLYQHPVYGLASLAVLGFIYVLRDNTIALIARPTCVCISLRFDRNSNAVTADTDLTDTVCSMSGATPSILSEQDTGFLRRSGLHGEWQPAAVT